MSDFSPKSQFILYHKEEAEALHQQSSERWFKISLNSALAQLAIHGASSDELKGARAFIDVLLNLPLTTKIERLPIKTLEVLGTEPSPESPLKKEEKK